MNPQEIQKQNIESTKIPEKKEGKNENLDIPKSAILSKYPNFDIFSKTINTLDNDTKNKLLAILASIPEEELTMYIEMDADNSNLITESDIKRFVQEKDNYSKNQIFIKNEEKKNDTTNVTDTTEKSKKENKEDEQKKKEDEQKSKTNALETLKKNQDKYKEIFGADSNFFKIFQENENNSEKIATELESFLKNPENRKAIFDKIASTGDAKLYQETYNSLSNLSPTISGYLSNIPSTIYKVEKLIPEKPDDKAIISQFPGANPKDIEKRGDLVSYGDKTIDLKTGKAFISGEGGYAIETSMKVPNSLDVRVKYQKERLEILDEIKTNEKILNLVESKESLKVKLEELKSRISNNENKGENLPTNIEINAIEKELQKIDEKLKQAVPGYKEDDDKNLKIFLKEKIEESKASLKGLKEKFDADMQKLLTAGQDEIKARDEKVRETISFLDDLGITNINQHDLQKIIRRININPQAFGFSKPIDLTKGFEGSATESHKQKKEFFNFFSKMYEKMGFTNPPISHSVIEGINKDPRLKNDTTFKQRLEDTGVTLGGALQIETFFTLIKEEPKKPQNTQEQ